MKRTISTRICKQCDKEYTSNAMLYCSRSCRAKHTGVGNGIKTGAFVNCSTCDSQLWRKGSLILKSKNHFCDKKCFGEFKSNLDFSWATGINNWNWQGGISFLGKSLYKQIRKIKVYSDWRKSIFKRDNYTCVNCKIMGGKLNADHYPIPFSTLIKENKINTLDSALNCDILWDINNGRTLCEPCHKKIGFKGSWLINKNC